MAPNKNLRGEERRRGRTLSTWAPCQKATHTHLFSCLTLRLLAGTQASGEGVALPPKEKNRQHTKKSCLGGVCDLGRHTTHRHGEEEEGEEENGLMPPWLTLQSSSDETWVGET